MSKYRIVVTGKNRWQLQKREWFTWSYVANYSGKKGFELAQQDLAKTPPKHLSKRSRDE